MKHESGYGPLREAAIMPRQTLLAIIATVSMLAVPSQALGSTIDFTLIPSNGTVTGPPGSTVGWGYSLTNNSPTEWFAPTLLNSDSFVNGAPVALFDFPSVAPGITLTKVFNAGTGVGLYELDWDAGAPPGFVNSGYFVLSGGWWDGNPLAGGNFLFTEPEVSLPYTATVSGGVQGVPEPSTWLLCLGGLVPIAFRNHLKKKGRREPA